MIKCGGRLKLEWITWMRTFTKWPKALTAIFHTEDGLCMEGAILFHMEEEC